MQIFLRGTRTRCILVSAGAVFAAMWVVASAYSQAKDDDDEVVQTLWRDPGPIGARDLYWGSGAADRVPVPPFMFVREETSGTKPKVDVTDSAGVIWRVKFSDTSSTGNEVHAEIAAARLMWALGYIVEEQYYVPDGRIEGVSGLRRAAEAISPDGSFRAARFERRPPEIERIGRWDVDMNPFVGTPQLSGLKILVMLLANWDFRSANTAVLRARGPDGRVEERYVLSDAGSAFGRIGGVFRKSTRWNLDDYTKQRVIRYVYGGVLEFRPRIPGLRDSTVPLEHARWFTGLMSQLSPEQVRQAFEAAGASPAEVEGFSAQVLMRIRELRDAVTEDDEDESRPSGD